MRCYVVWFTDGLDSDGTVHGFQCMADDLAHAVEQCRNAFPTMNLISIDRE